MRGNKFGTFGGVFTPSILTILGVIMYLRLPVIVGQAGLWGTLGIIAIAHIISVTTGLSVSSIATDKKVEAGGTYYIISRSLGLPIGGTLGLALFVGLSFSISLYLIGFSESFLSYWGYEVSINSIRIAGTIILLIVTTITLISTSLAIKTQYFIMVLIALSLLSIFLGKHELGPVEVALSDQAVQTIPFMVLFGIFFPAVTGFEAGVSMSGDLKDPKQSIPKGTIVAILVGLVVYIILTFFLSTTVDHNLLASDPQVLLKISWIPQIVIAGIWGATLSSALGSILAAPRILQATATDRISPKFFSKGVGAANEPRNALLLTFVIAEAGILIGELNVIARVVSIFFITTYGFLNLSCAFEAWTSADFRPNFKTPIWVSFLGALACFIVMIQLDFIATLGAILILGGLYLYLKRKELFLQGGDTWAGVWSSLAKTSILNLVNLKQHSRNWRPNILMFNGSDKSRLFMTKLGKAITSNLGLLSLFELKVTKDNLRKKLERTGKSDDGINKYFQYSFKCTDVYTAIDDIARVYGFAGLEPNTVLMGWSTKAENKDRFITLMGNIQQYNLSSFFLFHKAAERKMTTPTIDIWWSGWGRNLALALSTIRHLGNSSPWDDAQLRICILLNVQEDTDRIALFLKGVLKNYRLSASIKIVDNHVTHHSKQEVIARESAAADLAIIGIPDNNYDDLDSTYQFGCSICDQLSTVLFINASNAFEEHTILSDAVWDTKTTPLDWSLPPLEESRYHEINNDIIKIDQQGRSLQEQLYRKVFALSLENGERIVNELETLTAELESTLERSVKTDIAYQKHHALVRTKRHFFNVVIRLLVEVQGTAGTEQEEALSLGLEWYLEQLEKEISLFPRYKDIEHPKNQFTLQKGDSGSLRWYKLKLRVIHPWSQKSVRVRKSYREGAAYFLRDSRYDFLSALSTSFELTLFQYHKKLSLFLHSMDKSIRTILNVNDHDEQNNLIVQTAELIRNQIEELKAFSALTRAQYLGRLQVEYRKSLNHFTTQLDRIDFDLKIKKHNRNRKFNRKKKQELITCPQKLSQISLLSFETIRVTLLISLYTDLIEEHIQNYLYSLNQFLDKQRKKISQLSSALETLNQVSTDPHQVSLPDMDFAYSYPVDLFEDVSSKFRPLALTIPEEALVYEGEDLSAEGVNLPFRSMIVHVTDTFLNGPVNDTLEHAMDKIQKSNLVLKDLIGLAMFNAYNRENNPDFDSATESEIRTALRSIHNESKTLFTLFDKVLEDIKNQPLILKEKVKLHNLVELTGTFSSRVRAAKTRNLQSKIRFRVDDARETLKHFFVRVLYSRAKGILLARNLASIAGSTNEHVIAEVAKATPNQQLLQKLPHFYISLFSGRSSIADNFWVHRPYEEAQFKLAYGRYIEVRQGMILVLGERNSGKSAFCRHAEDKLLKGSSVFHIFPPEDGSVEVEEFDSSLQRVTKLEGTAKKVLSLLPYNSVIVIHDLELWWEQSYQRGLQVIRYIKELVEEFSTKCLFIVNGNPFAFDVINTAESLDTHCTNIIRCQPFNSMELRQLIITRHKSSGLKLDFGSGPNNYGEIKLARIFNKLFSHSYGNPGLAMSKWLIGVEGFSNQTILWKMPDTINEEIFGKIPDIWALLALQLIMHKRMGLPKLARTLQEEKDVLSTTTSVMKQLGLIVLYGKSSYQLNSNIEFELVEQLRNKGWLS